MRRPRSSLIITCVVLVLTGALCTQAGFLDKIDSSFRSAYKKSTNWSRRMMAHSKSIVAPSPNQIIKHGRSGAGPPSLVRAEPGADATTEAPQQTNSSYKARCFFWRKPSLKENPSLYFFSAKNHSPDTRGCKVDVKIHLNTTQNNNALNPQLLFDADEMREFLVDSGLYNGSYPTFFVTHGFLSKWNADNWMCDLKDFILDKTKANVFIVDWSGGSRPLLPIDYSAAVSNTKYVAQLVSEFINQLLPLSGQRDASRFHLIGHSLGAHISGYIGYSVKSIGYITGLDPAGPCFTSDSEQEDESASYDGVLDHGKRRLSPESAHFVLVLHTDTALFGLNENCGHYDVYINGGYKQPYCGSLSLSNRFVDLMNLNLKDSFNPNIACAHSYAHTLLDTFISSLYRGGRGLGAFLREQHLKEVLINEQNESKCYPMAYQCADWDSFRLGECGYCLDNDVHCVFTGLSLINTQPLKLNETDPSSTSESSGSRGMDFENGLAQNDTSGVGEVDDDGQFNDEDADDEDDGDNPGNMGQKTHQDDKMVPSSSSSKGQHFIKSGAKDMPSCIYHYQVIIAVRKSESTEASKVDTSRKHYYYLDVPLEQAGLLVDDQGNRLHDRLVQVSHKVTNPNAIDFLKEIYVRSIREQNLSAKFNAADEDIEFHTTLITFKQAPSEECQNSEIDGNTVSKKWQLCRPLHSIKEARLWSSNELKLDAVQWVGMNYMSGLSFKDRVTNSWLFERDLTEGLKSRDELSEINQASIGDLDPDRPKDATNMIKDPLRCWLSYLDMSDSGEASRNFKCNRSAKELKYTIRLNALKQKAF